MPCSSTSPCPKWRAMVALSPSRAEDRTWQMAHTLMHNVATAGRPPATAPILARAAMVTDARATKVLDQATDHGWFRKIPGNGTWPDLYAKPLPKSRRKAS